MPWSHETFKIDICHMRHLELLSEMNFALS